MMMMMLSSPCFSSSLFVSMAFHLFWTTPTGYWELVGNNGMKLSFGQQIICNVERRGKQGRSCVADEWRRSFSSLIIFISWGSSMSSVVSDEANGFGRHSPCRSFSTNIVSYSLTFSIFFFIYRDFKKIIIINPWQCHNCKMNLDFVKKKKENEFRIFFFTFS